MGDVGAVGAWGEGGEVELALVVRDRGGFADAYGGVGDGGFGDGIDELTGEGAGLLGEGGEGR